MRAPQAFQRLFKKSSTGKIVQWDIKVSDPMGDQSVGEITTTWGQVGGALQTTVDRVASGKNLGKKNETNAFQQALCEAKSRWEKQKKKGYVEKYADAAAGKVDEIIEGGVSPMLAHRYDEHGHKITFPAYVQPKLDGHRCIAVVENGKCTLWSRTRKPISSMPHIVAELESIAVLLRTDFILDGELYHHDYREKFEELTSYIRQESPKPGHEVVQFHIYDAVLPGLSYRERLMFLAEQINPCDNRIAEYSKDGAHQMQKVGRGPDGQRTLELVMTAKVEDEEDLMSWFDTFTKTGYEGAIVRNAGGHYVNKRSYDLQKIKEFQDAEFVIDGVEEGRGKLAGHAIFICKTEDGQEFRVKMAGPAEQLRQIYLKADQYIGRYLTTKFQGKTANGIPRFPIGLRLLNVL